VIADIRETIEYTPGGTRHYGRAIYAHAGGINFVVIPHRNWKGAVDMVTFTGGRHAECGPHNWQEWRNICYPMELPLRSAYGEPPQSYNGSDDLGSLVEGSRDFSGLMYRRNRYLDGASGQFTQPDPIGLAGGLNLYGFANGDPVSYSDPYGLSAEECCRFSGFLSFPTRLTETTSRLTDRIRRSPVGERVGAARDFVTNYLDMRRSDTIGADRYFHCRANCEATQRGSSGEATAEFISNTREGTDMFKEIQKGIPPRQAIENSRQDEAANRQGRDGARANTGQNCVQVCRTVRPAGLPARY
jgi:RHS repeat-associated protein